MKVARKIFAVAVVIAAFMAMFTSTADAKAAAVTITKSNESYGADPLQVVTVSRNTAVTAPGKTVIFLHGGGWNSGGRGSLEAEAAEWAKTGWVSINVSYRLGVTDGTPDDGKNILADVLAVLAKYRVKSYVDPDKIVVYGESAGGHLATWLGAYKGPQIAATVAISPVSSIAGAINAGLEDGATSQVKNLAERASEYFGYSVGTTDAHRYVDRAKNMFLVYSTSEWVDPNIHAKVLAEQLGDRATVREYAGSLHAGLIVDANPQLLIDLRHWADAELPD